ncbi:MAG: hypothetical protein A2445_04440 [Candidatus Jacksonbacteria bacterium RIFOXYC2_FULL_44_29]|nr:MAG: hypothetical protein UV19_C0003G0011 [Parcubacteria group bacterium GW2011_GWA2_42_28]KKT55830.1 MAG: hypothetical protein UW45_C0004G0011 [Parcubacteria group bacterium GW2011_GWC2_44_22]OGY75610.1 MAG: hypothetical protein A2240_03630 [Candidatus Jacksonbacteria bacterium RIFOXYA2_FULL_43_12]OGY76584.1 MAG: hypothetical protein A2295_01370 [Candidatus Jacksonbacteria bacterium RIFOXYB2_FULL_44_15]OGY78308.1 MAG: hypothetical protein A2445_04440 [Candidatus Jacksonbacteria bacterium RI
MGPETTKFSEVGIREREFQRIETKDVSPELFAEIFQYLTYLDSGEDGVIMSFDLQSLPETLKAKLLDAGLLDTIEEDHDRQVLKMLKVYKFGGAQAEAQLQRKAQKIVSSHAGEKQLANIPDVTVCFNTSVPDISADKKNFSNLASLGSAGRQLEVIEMDYVPGMNFKTYLLRQLICKDDVLQRELGLGDKNIETWDQERWRQFLLDPPTQQTIQHFLKFAGLPEKHGPTKATEVNRENCEKLKERMLLVGAEIDKKILDVLANTLAVLHSHDFYHNDLHEAQLMVDLDGDNKVDLVSLIDFKYSGECDEKIFPDATIIKIWQELTTTQTERAAAKHEKFFNGTRAIYVDMNTIKLTEDKKHYNEQPARLQAKIQFQKNCQRMLLQVKELNEQNLDPEKRAEKVKELCQLLARAGLTAGHGIIDEHLNELEGALLLSVYNNTPAIAKELVQVMSVDYWRIMNMDAKKVNTANYGYWQNLQKIMSLPDAEQVVGGQLAKAESAVEKTIKGNSQRLSLERALAIEKRI